MTFPTRHAMAAIGVLLALGACTTTPDLKTTEQFDISGTWTLVRPLSDEPPNPRRMMNRADRKASERSQPRSASRVRIQGALFAFITQDFPVLAADEMIIEQQPDSMGVNYRPGPYRDVSWGERERGLWRVFAGWNEEGQLVIESRGNDIRTTERHFFREDGLLQVDILVRADNQNLERTRVFRRSR